MISRYNRFELGIDTPNICNQWFCPCPLSVVSNM